MYKFDSIEHAAKIFLEAPERSPMAEAAFHYLLNNSPEFREKMQQGLKEFYPDLKPGRYDDNGTPYYELSEVARVMGISEDEISDHAEELKKAGYVYPTPENLHRVQ